MEVRKNKFFIFLFSLFPGAGQMYMGAFGKGAIIMVAFCLWCCFFNSSDILFLFVPVLWFYAFMDTHYLKRLSDEEIKKSNDDFVKKVTAIVSGDNVQTHSYKRLGGFIIFIGVVYFILDVLGIYADYHVSRVILGLFITFIIIFLGIRIARHHASAVKEAEAESAEGDVIFSNYEEHECTDEECSCENHINELIDEAIAEKHCPFCGAEVFEGDKFCSNCGKSLIPEKPKEKICSCGQKLSEEAKFCPSCGKKYEEDSAAPEKEKSENAE